jgi:hypothetical protein
MTQYSIKQLGDLDFQGVSQIQNLPDATDLQHPVTLAQQNGLRNEIKALIEGKSEKNSARTIALVNVDLAGVGTPLDNLVVNGVTLADKDVLLLSAQDDPAENWLYVYDQPNATLTRTDDSSTWSEIYGAMVRVVEGDAGAGRVYFSDVPETGILGTDNIGVLDSTTLVALPTASVNQAGIIKLATGEAIQVGTETDTAVTPAELHQFLEGLGSLGVQAPAIIKVRTVVMTNFDFSLDVATNGGWLATLLQSGYLVPNDVVLLTGQLIKSENGLYFFDGTNLNKAYYLGDSFGKFFYEQEINNDPALGHWGNRYLYQAGESDLAADTTGEHTFVEVPLFLTSPVLSAGEKDPFVFTSIYNELLIDTAQSLRTAYINFKINALAPSTDSHVVSALIGDDSTTTFTIDLPSFGSVGTIVQVLDTTNNNAVVNAPYAFPVVGGVEKLELWFNPLNPPATNQYRVNVVNVLTR